MEIKTQVVIDATPDKVWHALTDFDTYPNWNPFVKSIIGKPEVGKQITVSISPPGDKSMTFRATVLAFEHNKEFRWLGKLFFKGVFDGEHKFELIDWRDGTTTLIHSETFNGILVGLFKRKLENNTKRGFELMNKSLKNLVESNIKLPK
jgi:hypothetical protein